MKMCAETQTQRICLFIYSLLILINIKKILLENRQIIIRVGLNKVHNGTCVELFDECGLCRKFRQLDVENFKQIFGIENEFVTK